MTKIVIATTQGGLDDDVCAMFGRAPTFTLVEVDGSDIVETSTSPNQYADAVGGAGVQAAQWVINSGAQAVIAGRYGPKASEVFSRSDVKVLGCGEITVREAVQRYIEGVLAEATPESAEAQGYGPGSGMGRGSGRGGGMGMGHGRGKGQGRGGGMGRGQGGRR